MRLPHLSPVDLAEVAVVRHRVPTLESPQGRLEIVIGDQTAYELLDLGLEVVEGHGVLGHDEDLCDASTDRAFTLTFGHCATPFAVLNF